MTTPANWYPDPEDPNGLRYWDGTTWTEHRAPAVAPEAAAEPPAAASAEVAPSEQATSVVQLPAQQTSGLDQPTSVIKQRPAVDPLDTSTPLPEEPEAPTPGAHRAPDAEASYSAPPAAAASYERAPSYGQAPSYEQGSSYQQPTGYGSDTPSYRPLQPHEQPPAGPPAPPAGSSGGSNKKLIGILGGVAALVLVVAVVLVYFFVIKDDDTKTTASSTSSKTTASASKTATSKSTTSETAAPAGGGQTIEEYVTENGIVETSAIPGQDGAPAVNLPTPAGWQILDPSYLPEYSYAGISYTGADGDPSLIPNVIAYMAKLTGNVDTNALFERAPNELLGYDAYEPISEGAESDLGGFQAYALAGTYVDEDGTPTFVAQKTVLIPAGDGVYVLRLYGFSSPDPGQQAILGAALDAIDAGTTIG